jgi:hypothetical protein
MRHYKVNKIVHTVFEALDEVPEDIHYLDNWRESTLGDWVLADDGCVIEILREGRMTKSKGKDRIVEYVGTCTGTFVRDKKTKMDTSKRENIYSFGGTYRKEKSTLSSNEQLFVLYHSTGLSPTEAYLRAFPTKDPHYAKVKGKQLIKKEKVHRAMKEELKPVCEKLKIDPESVLVKIKEKADNDKDKDQLKALFKLSDILDLEDKHAEKVTQVTGLAFQGFSDEMLESAERPKKLKE